MKLFAQINIGVWLLVFLLGGGLVQANPSKDWKKWLDEINEDLKESKDSFLGVNDVAYLKSGDRIFILDPVAAPHDFKFGKDQTEAWLYQIDVEDGRALLQKRGSDKKQNMTDKFIELGKGVRVIAYLLDAQKSSMRLFIFNDSHPHKKGFNGLDFFPYNPEARIFMKLTLHDDPKAIELLTSRGDKRQYYIVGQLSGVYQGVTIQLNAYSSTKQVDKAAGSLFLTFRDKSSNVTTYGAGRYIDIEDPKGVNKGELWVDFNQAYNPYCARSSFYNCVLPPGTPLPVAIEAGEKYKK